MKNNYKAFKKLLKQYKDISLSDLEDNWDTNGARTIGKITGFGSPSCILCKEAKENTPAVGIGCYRHCKYCLYEQLYDRSCNTGRFDVSYKAMARAKSPSELMQAIQDRIKIVEEVIEKYKSEKEPDNIWDIKEGNCYYIVAEWENEVDDFVWSGCSIDNSLRKHNNAFIDKEKAKYEQLKRMYEAKLRKATTEAWNDVGKELDWENENQKKWGIEYNHLENIENKITTKFTYYFAYFPDYYYFPDKIHIKKFIIQNKELIEKFFGGVK